jgi:hypothetical protein
MKKWTPSINTKACIQTQGQLVIPKHLDYFVGKRKLTEIFLVVRTIQLIKEVERDWIYMAQDSDKQESAFGIYRMRKVLD